MKFVGFILAGIAFLFVLVLTVEIFTVFVENSPSSLGQALIGLSILAAGLCGACAASVAICWYFTALEEKEHQSAENARLGVENARLAALRFAAEQQSLQTSLANHVSESVQMASGLSQLAQRADRALDAAEQEFAEGVFAPFWDAIERAVKDLATFTYLTDAIVRHAREHREEAPRLKGNPPQFQIGIDTLPDASHVAKRMQSIVRRAQKDFHFATIYEQRKTNQLLVAGFSNLAHAISDLGDRLDSSLEQLSSVVSIGFSDLASAQREAAENLSAELRLSREQDTQESAERRKHEQQEREMLDNIQRRRKPR